MKRGFYKKRKLLYLFRRKSFKNRCKLGILQMTSTLSFIIKIIKKYSKKYINLNWKFCNKNAEYRGFLWLFHLRNQKNRRNIIILSRNFLCKTLNVYVIF